MAKRADQMPFEEMAKGPFAALWNVPEAGFYWDADTELDPVLCEQNPEANGLNAKGPYLVWPDGDPAKMGLRRYAVLAVPGLHRRFSRLLSTEAAIVEFANAYGQLGLQEAILPRGGNSGTVRRGESLWLWRHEIATMARLLEVWDQVQAGDAGKLGQHVIWNDSPQRVEWQDATGLGYRLLASEAMHPEDELLRRWRFGEAVEPARYYVHDEVNKRMRGNVSPAVLPFRRGDIYLFPHNLLAGLYVHFALELAGRVIAARQCRGCGRYFTPTHASQQYCDANDGGTCRKRAWYHRNRRREDK